MQNVKPFLVRFARSAVPEPAKPEPAKPENGRHEKGHIPDPPPPPTTIHTRVNAETTDDN